MVDGAKLREARETARTILFGTALGAFYRVVGWWGEALARRTRRAH